MIKCHFKDRVPRDYRGNLLYRANVIQKVQYNTDYAEALWEACRRDPVFFCNGFVYTYDPRCQPFSKIPFILYPYQEEGLLKIIDAIGSHDLLIEKSRDMGASWLCCLAFFWEWLFKPGRSFLMVSRTENYVDDAGNPKSLFWKIDFAYDNLPAFLRVDGYKTTQHRRRLHIENPANGSVIDGESTTGNVARGDRRTAIMLDEFAAVEQGHSVLRATRDATDCRLFNSTAQGINNAYYDVAQTGIRKLRFHWSAHPKKAVGLYTTGSDGGLEVLDRNGFPEGYKPILDGKTRSPWYDIQCDRAASFQEIAQELDCNYLGSSWQFFNSEPVYESIRRFARPPVVVGDLEYDILTAEPVQYREHEEGRCHLWCMLRDGNPPSDRKYVVSVDVAAGTGSSNSCITAWDRTTAEKVLEYVNPYIRPEDCARQAVAIAKWLGNAYLIWESNGPGRQFGSRVLELHYSPVYFRRRDEAISKKQSDVPGWASTKETKAVLLGNYRSAVEQGKCVNRSKIALEETLEYVFSPTGAVEHARERNKDDPSGAGASHGDRVIADALAWHALNERQEKPQSIQPVIPVGSLAWRKKMKEDAKQPVGVELGEGWL